MRNINVLDDAINIISVNRAYIMYANYCRVCARFLIKRYKRTSNILQLSRRIPRCLVLMKEMYLLSEPEVPFKWKAFAFFQIETVCNERMINLSKSFGFEFKCSRTTFRKSIDFVYRRSERPTGQRD